jgi:hypothetical protein
MENHHAILLGKLTISMAMFNSFLFVYQRFTPIYSGFTHWKWWICSSFFVNVYQRVISHFIRFYLHFRILKVSFLKQKMKPPARSNHPWYIHNWIIAIENDLFIVNWPIDSMVDLSIVFCSHLPEASPHNWIFLAIATQFLKVRDSSDLMCHKTRSVGSLECRKSSAVLASMVSFRNGR